jgi:hypothetical protein
MKKIRHIHGHPFNTFSKRPEPGLGMLLWPKYTVQASPPHNTPSPPYLGLYKYLPPLFSFKILLSTLHITKGKDIVF